MRKEGTNDKSSGFRAPALRAYVVELLSCARRERSSLAAPHLAGADQLKGLRTKPFELFGAQKSWGSGVNEMNSCLQPAHAGGVCAEPHPWLPLGKCPHCRPRGGVGSGRQSAPESSCVRALRAAIGSLTQPQPARGSGPAAPPYRIRGM